MDVDKGDESKGSPCRVSFAVECTLFLEPGPSSLGTQAPGGGREGSVHGNP